MFAPPKPDVPLIVAIPSQFLLLVIVLLPYVAALFLTKNRRCWLLWHRLSWRLTLAVVAVITVVRVVYYVGLPILWAGSNEALGSGFYSIILTFGLVETYPILTISQIFHGWTPMPYTEYFAIDFGLLFVLFSLLHFSKTRLAKRAYEIE
ncbi:MAG: hypothetical protein JST12_07405 [Armatimonadetes bacterium]|nr:hypothetical protein [Armatimonadota bacterium]MBS1701470.1 hypothetical protein [Armatimonadota bacterium]MBS1725478.1 hypothetical protein [Armatimonadota bacterium]